VRISGTHALRIAEQVLDLKAPLVTRHATFARTRAALDETVTTYFRAPESYTGQDVVEVSAHGSPVTLQSILRAAMDAGARLAEPGEFTLRAFLNGKRDLVQAEAVGDLIAAATPLQARTAFDQLNGTLTTRIAALDEVLFDLIARLEASLDFPDEGYHFIEAAAAASAIADVIARLDALLGDARRGRMIREGATVVIAGRPNVGKSSLFNRIAGADRAIVTSIPGTTRDLVTEVVDVGGLPVSMVDTAGWHETGDVVEREGVARGERARGAADLVLVVLDQSEPLEEDDIMLLQATSDQPRLVVFNKVDLEPVVHGFDGRRESQTVRVSAETGAGLDELRRAIAATLVGGHELRDTVAVSNARHIDLLEKARTALIEGQRAAKRGDTPEEFLLTHLQACRERFDEIVGTRTSEDVLRHIFERFCIGK